MQSVHSRLANVLNMLEHGLVERRREVRLALLAALAGEHTLLIGPPGTAKSELARRLHRAFRDSTYFERLLTRFSVPEELFGPLSISALEQDRYERHTAGFLPEASIAFIDEVFKANSAILNALLTLLNEREFDNGSGRMHCPLISAIGATNAIPEDELAEAFLDRFLMRIPVAPVSATGFRALIERAVDGCDGADPMPALDAFDRSHLAQAASSVCLPDEVAGILAELRAWFESSAHYVSDRRWVKIVGLLKVACASEERKTVSLWDLWLLPCCVSVTREQEEAVGDWICKRLGVREGFSPERLTRVVEAFEAQLSVEREANDLDYDEAGRLRFAAEDRATELADSVGDAKGGAQAVRLSYTRKRRYGQLHIGARTRQIDEVIERVAEYAAEVAARRTELTAFVGDSLWVDNVLALRTDASLQDTMACVAALRERLLAARAGFEALPRLSLDSGCIPEPVAHASFDV